MTAEEMFKKLGYEVGQYTCRGYKEYVSETNSIYFDGTDESISITNNADRAWDPNEVVISKGLLKTINKQIKELKESGEW